MKKKICFIVSSILTAKFFLRFHIEKLSKEYDVYLVGNFNDDDIKSIAYFNLKGVKHINIERNISLFKDIKSVITLTSYFKEMKFDAIHSLAPKAGLISAISGKLARIKNRIHIFTGQVWHTKKGLFRLLLKHLDKIIVLLNTKIIIDSHSQRDFLIKENVVSNKKSIVLGKGSISGVDINRFYPNKELRKHFRKNLNIHDDTIVFLFMGRINQDKGVYDLAKAFKILLQIYKEKIHLLFVGYDEGDHIENISNLINSNNNFTYFGSTDRPEDIIHVGDVFCLPSYREGFGTSIIEASICKLAIICSDTYGLRDTIIDKETGYKHQVGNIEELTKKMKLIIENKNIITKFGNNGFDYVKSNFLAQTISNEWLNFYASILNTKNAK